MRVVSRPIRSSARDSGWGKVLAPQSGPVETTSLLSVNSRKLKQGRPPGVSRSDERASDGKHRLPGWFTAWRDLRQVLQLDLAQDLLIAPRQRSEPEAGAE
jgi:hypothetical protein